MTGKYVAGQGSGEAAEAEKAFVSLNWVLAEDVFDIETQLEWGFLDYLLLGTSAAPLRKVASWPGCSPGPQSLMHACVSLPVSALLPCCSEAFQSGSIPTPALCCSAVHKSLNPASLWSTLRIWPSCRP